MTNATVALCLIGAGEALGRNGGVQAVPLGLHAVPAVLVGVLREDHGRRALENGVEQRVAERRAVALEARRPHGLRVLHRAHHCEAPDRGRVLRPLRQRLADRAVEQRGHDRHVRGVARDLLEEELRERLARGAGGAAIAGGGTVRKFAMNLNASVGTLLGVSSSAGTWTCVSVSE